MNPFNVLMRPILSEKSNRLRESGNKYTFLVNLGATKADVRKAIEKMFDVKVKGVTTVITRGKVKRRGNTEYKAQNTKKAVVTLPEGAKIGLFEDM